jgi:hypothetical protein
VDVSQVAQTSVHHHIGGLEITIKFKIPIIIVHHHIGGLEIIFVKPARGSHLCGGEHGVLALAYHYHFLSHLCGGEH